MGTVSALVMPCQRSTLLILVFEIETGRVWDKGWTSTNTYFGNLNVTVATQLLTSNFQVNCT